MYLYSTDDLGECDVTRKSSIILKGLDPLDPANGICALIQDPMSGRFIGWLEYINRASDAKDPLSKFRRFLNEDCYKDFQKRFCGQVATTKPTPPVIQPKQPLTYDQIREIFEALTRIRLQPPKRTSPSVPNTLKMRDLK
jgi:hypothetical protein